MMSAGSPDHDDSARLRAVIAESDLIVGEYAGSSDPVAIRKVTAALSTKAHALGTLERFDEYLDVCEQLLAQPDQSSARRLTTLAMKSAAFAELHADADVVRTADEVSALFNEFDQPDRVIELVARVGMFKVAALGRLERTEEAIRADEELVARLGDHPAASPQVTMALCDQSSRLLTLPGRLDEAIAVSEIVRSRLDSESDEVLDAVARAVLDHVTALAGVSSPTAVGVAALSGLILGNLTLSISESGRALLSRRRLGFGPLLRAAEGFEASISAIGPVDRTRRRLNQAVLVSRELVVRIGASEDPELQRLSAVARFKEASALTLLGRVRESVEANQALAGGVHAGTAQGFQLLADTVDRSTLLGKLNQISFLRVRAEGLGRGDDAVAQLAFDDSIQALDPEVRNSRFTRWTARLLRFGTDAEIVVPDHLPERDS